MAEPTQAPSAPTSEEAVKINWEEASSKDGTKYEVGRPDVPKPPTDENLVGSKADFQISVKWTVGGDSWIDTPLEVRNTTAIWRYKLHLSSHPFHKYVLEISITDDHYDYYFGDEEGDSYSLSTWVAGDHYVQYSSKKPTITRISGH